MDPLREPPCHAVSLIAEDLKALFDQLLKSYLSLPDEFKAALTDIVHGLIDELEAKNIEFVNDFVEDQTTFYHHANQLFIDDGLRNSDEPEEFNETEGIERFKQLSCDYYEDLEQKLQGVLPGQIGGKLILKF